MIQNRGAQLKMYPLCVLQCVCVLVCVGSTLSFKQPHVQCCDTIPGIRIFLTYMQVVKLRLQ